jgi:hypothetical protein
VVGGGRAVRAGRGRAERRSGRRLGRGEGGPGRLGARQHKDDVVVRRRPGRQQRGAGSAAGGASAGEMERVERE